MDQFQKAVGYGDSKGDPTDQFRLAVANGALLIAGVVDVYPAAYIKWARHY